MADDRSPDLGQSWKFWLSALQLRLRFFVFVACLAALFALWPWLSAAWDRTLFGWGNDKDELAVGGGSEFFCPMDPGVVSAWPAICPICNMDLIRRQKNDAKLLPEGVVARMQISPYKLALAGVHTAAIEQADDQTTILPSESSAANKSQTVRVPTTAIVYREQRPLVYIETMPGMFDAIPVTLSTREDDTQFVTGQLQPGQRVAVMGTLLLDAESRLNPNLSTQYFGAAQPSLASAAPSLPAAHSANQPANSSAGKVGKNKPQVLSVEDQRLVEEQKLCPVTEAPLGSMGTPAFVEVNGQRIALCCAGCRGRVLADPERYVKWLADRLHSGQQNQP